ncbi:MAG: 50S ribosome-binding GTPase [Planctomycetes bacterium]|nr:50S ribosome-binding GTPase [Planctomycetota bacterium]
MLSVETIAAVSSPAGAAARGVARLSGPLAFDRVGQLVAPAPPRSRGVRSGRLSLPGFPPLPARVYGFVAPRSFTGEDVVEVHTLGLPLLMEALMEALCGDGVRAAGPGEFTARAFHHGRIDLTQAEGVAALIAAESESDRRAALEALEGRRGDAIRALRDEVANLLALTEASIDFTDQDINLLPPATLAASCRSLAGRVAEAEREARAGAAPRAGGGRLFRATLVGRANAGKSSLFNALLGRRRVVVSAEPGATRDVIEEEARFGDSTLLLADTAGVIESDDLLDRAAAARRAAAMGRADLLVWVRAADGGDAAPPPGVDVDRGRTLRVLHKIDLAPGVAAPPAAAAFDVATSTVTGEGLDTLRAALAARALAAFSGSGAPMNARLAHALGRARAALDDLGADGERCRHGEIAALALREAAAALGEVAGDLSSEEVLNRVFARFCIGK